MTDPKAPRKAAKAVTTPPPALRKQPARDSTHRCSPNGLESARPVGLNRRRGPRPSRPGSRRQTDRGTGTRRQMPETCGPCGPRWSRQAGHTVAPQQRPDALDRIEAGSTATAVGATVSQSRPTVNCPIPHARGEGPIPAPPHRQAAAPPSRPAVGGDRPGATGTGRRVDPRPVAGPTGETTATPGGAAATRIAPQRATAPDDRPDTALSAGHPTCRREADDWHLLQMSWCRFDRHGKTGHAMSLQPRRRKSSTSPTYWPPRRNRRSSAFPDGCRSLTSCTRAGGYLPLPGYCPRTRRTGR